jgi:hypothetical protein
MRNLWKDSGLTIVLLPSGVQGDKLYSVAKLWTELRMITPAIWVRHELLTSETVRPPQQRALVLGTDQSGQVTEIEVDLFEQLARQPLNRVRLLVVRNALPNVEFDHKQDLLVDLLSDYLDWSMPASITVNESSEKVVDFVKLNLITSPTEHRVQEASKYQHSRFNAHFVAAAEDRATPASGDAFIRHSEDSEKFAGFTMLHVGSLGGLWVGLPQGTYEMVKPGAWLGDKAFVSRVFLSSILTDGLARRASTRVLERAGNPDSGFVDLNSDIPIQGTVPIPDSEIDAWINWMIGEVFKFDNGILSYHSPVPADEVAKRKLTLFRQMVEFVVFAWDKLIRVPYFALRWIYKGLVQIANSVFQGGNRGASIIPVPEEKMDKRDQLVLAKLASVTETKMKADAALASPVTPSHVKSSPELWSKVRKLIFGMLDGSNLETFGVPKSENGWPVIYRVSSIFNDPSKRTQILNPETLSPEEPLELSWEELAKYPELQKAFTDKRAAVDGENLKSLTKLVKLNDDVAAKKLRLTALKDHLEVIQPSDKDETEVAEEDSAAAKDQPEKVVAE